MNKIIKANPREIADRTIEFVISDETVDDVGDMMKSDGCDWSRFEKNPQFLGFHNSWDFPFGKPIAWASDPRKKQVVSKVYFPKVEELSTSPEYAAEHVKEIDMMFWMYKMKILNAISIGFDILEDSNQVDADGNNIHVISKWKIYEFSAVPLPMNENALQKAKLTADQKSWIDKERKAFEEKDMIEKGCIPFHAYPLADEATAWDGPKEVSSAEIDDLMKMATWYDSSKDKADLTKGDFKMPHHMKEEYKTVWKGVAAAYGVLLGARGGAKIPEGDMDACKGHLKKHYAEWDKPVPEDKAAWEIQWKEIDSEHEEIDGLSHKAIDTIKNICLTMIEEAKMEKSGARLSQASKEKLGEIQKCHEMGLKAHKESEGHYTKAYELMNAFMEDKDVYATEQEDGAPARYEDEGGSYRVETNAKGA